VVPKHRRSELEPSMAPVGAPVNTAEFWPEKVGYSQAVTTAEPMAVHGQWPAGYGYPAWNGYNDDPSWNGYDRPSWNGYNAPAWNDYDGGAADPRWAPAPEGHSWQELQNWQEWAPPPMLYPDHPSAPVPRVQFPADHPSGPMPAFREPDPDLDWREDGQEDWRERPGYHRQRDPGWQESTEYRRSQDRDSIWTAGRVHPLADSQKAQLTQEAQDYAAAIREAAEREAEAITQQATSQAAAIREAAERDARELLARLDSMSGELSRVAAYVTENLGAPVTPAIAPALPDAAPAPALPGPRPASPETRPAKPDSRPARPDSKPADPAKPRTTPAGKPQKRPRQLQAMRIATYSTAALLSFAVISGAAEIGVHGYKFFVFRGGGVGQTPGNETDQQFLAREAAAAHHAAAPRGRHARRSHGVVEVHHR
jgi:hypothetical protein